MTKAEALACEEIDAIWSAMHENQELQSDREVWDHMTRLYAQEERAREQEFFGSAERDTMTHIDYRKKD